MPRHKHNEFSNQQFAERLEQALRVNPNAPPKFHGERVWLSEQDSNCIEILLISNVLACFDELDTVN